MTVRVLVVSSGMTSRAVTTVGQVTEMKQSLSRCFPVYIGSQLYSRHKVFSPESLRIGPLCAIARAQVDTVGTHGNMAWFPGTSHMAAYLCICDSHRVQV